MVGVLVHLLGDAINSMFLEFYVFSNLNYPNRYCRYHICSDYLETPYASAILRRSCGLSRDQLHHLWQCDTNEYTSGLLQNSGNFLISSPAMKLGRILLEAVPIYLDLEKVKNDLLAV